MLKKEKVVVIITSSKFRVYNRITLIPYGNQ